MSAGEAIAAGVIGNVVSQGIAIALGVQDGFNWKGLATSALSSGVSAGIGNFGLSGVGGVVANAVVTDAVTQGIATLTGLQRSFSWREVALTAVSAPISLRLAARSAVQFATRPSLRSPAPSWVELRLGCQGRLSVVSGIRARCCRMRLVMRSVIRSLLRVSRNLGQRINAGDDYGLDLFALQDAQRGQLSSAQSSALTRLETLASDRYQSRTLGVPTASTNRALADAFESAGGDPKIGAFNLLKARQRRTTASAQGPMR